MTSNGDTIDYTQMAADIVSAYVAYNHIAVSELPELIIRTREAVANLGGSNAAVAAPVERPTAAAIRRSVTHEALISFEDGKTYKTLKRHLTKLGLTPDAYRSKWGLPADYPMIAPGYAERRSQLAKGFGLGRPQRAAASEPVAS
ncbi:MucR family transcriptional regulator [Methylobacterium sp. yr668]|uniref:MucR family transcriptional regulator n=1 Tax=Methylobacterium sp. yr668 TaxID=1761801 RepID=UPI0008EB1367|nr:MucR family transcriptional regulator [Methylobacterium sp. yr668]SFT27004.1 transcriptional regulator, MucR family [Methylobacterium sp. yr668]